MLTRLSIVSPTDLLDHFANAIGKATHVVIHATKAFGKVLHPLLQLVMFKLKRKKLVAALLYEEGPMWGFYGTAFSPGPRPVSSKVAWPPSLR